MDRDTLARVREALQQRELLEGVGILLVGCSGGGDSVALAHLLSLCAAGDGPRLIIGHVDHGVRGEESRRDRRRAEALASELALDFVDAEVDPGGEPGEAELRRARHEGLSRLVGRVGADAVALGHTADDVAETVLLNAARGAGPGGLASLRWRRRVDGLLLIRPLLGSSRDELRAFLRREGVLWEEDSTNQDLRMARNRIRHRVLPELEAAVPGASAALVRLSGILAAEESWWDERLAGLLERHRLPEPHPGALALDVDPVAALDPAQRARLLRAALATIRGHLQGIELRHVEFMQELLDGDRAACDLPGVRVRREGSRLRFLPLENRRLAAIHTRPGARDES